MTRPIPDHAHLRAFERYGIHLDRSEYAQLCCKLGFHDITGRDDCVRLRGQEDGRVAYAVWLKGEWVLVVFAPDTAQVVTVLPKANLKQWRWRLPW